MRNPLRVLVVVLIGGVIVAGVLLYRGLSESTEERLLSQVQVPDSWELQKEYQVATSKLRAYLVPPDDVTADSIVVPSTFEVPPGLNMKGRFGGYRPVAVWLVRDSEGCGVEILRETKLRRHSVVWDDLSSDEQQQLTERELALVIVASNCKIGE